MKKKIGKYKKKRKSIEVLLEKRKFRVYPLNSRPDVLFVVPLPGENLPTKLPWPKTKKV